jgi:hypothetical protein
MSVIARSFFATKQSSGYLSLVQNSQFVIPEVVIGNPVFDKSNSSGPAFAGMTEKIGYQRVLQRLFKLLIWGKTRLLRFARNDDAKSFQPPPKPLFNHNRTIAMP